MEHDWIKSTLGHGETMCSRCKVTNREAAAIGMIACDAPPAAANDMGAALRADGEKLRDLTGEDQGPFDDHFEDPDGDDTDDADDMSCGELPEGGCSLAGTEWCDWKCPHSDGMAKRMNEKRS